MFEAAPTILESQATPSYFRLLLVCFACIGFAGIVYIALKVQSRALVVCCLLAVGLALTLVGFRKTEVRSAILAEQQAEAEAAELQRLYDRLHRPRIKLESGDLVDSESSDADEQPTRSADAKKSKSASKTPEADAKDPQRPAWVDQVPKRVGNVYRKVVVSDPYDTVEGCYRALQRNKLREVVNERLDELAPDRYRPDLEKLGLGPEFIWREICHDEWVETLDMSVGEMKRVYALMEFDAAVDRQLADAYRDYERQFRVAEVGSAAGFGIGGLALLFSLLKVDTWTKGYYTKRLFFGVPAVIIAVVTLLNS